MMFRLACQVEREISRNVARRLSTPSSFSALRRFSSNSTEIADYFELFGLSANNFSIDQSQMKQSYLKLMNEHHPDKQQHQQNTDEEKLTAETITHAYQILKSPHTRALHWLELQGSPLGEDSGSNNDDETLSFTNQQDLVGMEFLMEIMEWREAIEDAGSDQAKLEAIGNQTQVLHKSCEQALEDLIDGSDIDSVTLKDARQLTAQLQYWNRLERTLKEQLEVG